MEQVVKCCGKVLEWKLKWTDRDGDWYEKTCDKCGQKHNLKCKLSKETLAILEDK